ncbi:MAG: hypothetical protein K2X80_07765 [Pseudomonadaceae bacterium]|nr:hypothetical protein [Pseudomonadaceae bacterium]
MIKELQHPLDEVRRFGFTAHGLVMTNEGVRYVNGQPFALGTELANSFSDGSANLPPEDFGNTHLLRVPGVAPLGMTALELAAEAALGRVWQDYALLSGITPGLFGDALGGGWVCIDEAGGRWLIQPTGAVSPRYGRVFAGSALVLDFTVKPYGYMGVAPAAPVVLSALLADIGQADPPGITAPNGTALDMRITSISSTGRKVLIALYPAVGPDSKDPRDMPYGWLMLAVTGAGPSLAVALTVYRSRADALGARVYSETPGGIPVAKLIPTLVATEHSVVRDGNGNVISGQGVWEWAGFTKHRSGDPYKQSPTTYSFREGSTVRTTEIITKRLLCLAFDALDVIVEVSADYSADRQTTHADPAIVARGSVTASAAGPSAGYSVNGIVGSLGGGLTLDVTLAASWTATASITLKRGGVAFDSFSYDGAGSASHVDTYTLGVGGMSVTYEDLLSRGAIYNFETGAVTWLMAVSGYRWEVLTLGYIPDEAWVRSATVKHGAAVIDTLGGVGERRPSYSWDMQRARLSVVWASDLPYVRHEYAPQRLCNHITAGRYEQFLSAPALVASSTKTLFLATTAGIWTNPGPGDTPLDRRHLTGSYQPATHQVHATFDWTPATRTNALWI